MLMLVEMLPASIVLSASVLRAFEEIFQTFVARYRF
jgi:hypothetical protein